MAGKREYSMDFLLNARLNGGFSSSFSKAQQEFSRLGKEIQSVNRLQSDISAYQKQQAAVNSTAAKLQNLQQQHDLLQREISETSGSTASLEREKLKLEQRIAATATALENQKQKLEATGARLKEAGVDTGNLAQKEAELAEKTRQLSAEQERAAEGAQNYGATAVNAVETVSAALAAAGIAAALKEIAEAYAECVKVAGNFEAGMSNVEALSGATAGEMADLTAKAKELGATTVFTAQEAADAMGYMGMAGWEASEMLAGMDGVLQLAAASGEDLAMVSDIVTDSMTAFGMTAADTSRYADVLAAAATKSNTSVAYMGETFKYAAPVAGALGYSIEDVSVAIGLMANSGIKGSVAGTSLRNVFNGLLEGATLTSAAFGEYEYTAVKADGTMRSFSETIEDLRYYFDQMTEAEKVANAETIAGMRGYAGLLAILNATNEDYATLTDSINNCTGAAQRMANIKLDNLNGELTLMDSAWEALKTTLGEQFNPELRALTEIGTDLLGGINEFVQDNPALVRGVMATVGALGAGVAVLTGVATVTKVLIPLMTTLTATIPGVNVIMGVTAAVAGVVGVVTALVTAQNEAIPSVKELTEAAREMEDTMGEATAAFDETVSSTMAAASVADTYISKLEEMEAAGVNTEEETRQYHNTLALLCQVVPELSGLIDLQNNTIEGGTAALRANTEAWRQNALQQAYQEQLTALMGSYSEVLIEAEKNSIGLTKAQYDLQAAEQRLTDTQNRMGQLWDEAEAEAKAMQKEYGLWADATTYLSQEYYDLQNSIYDINDEIWAAQETIENYEEAIEDGAAAVAAAEAEIALAEEAVRNLTDATNEDAEAAAEAARQSEELASMMSTVAEEVAALAEAYTDAYEAAYTSISGQYALWDEAAAVVATSAGTINSALESQVEYWANYNANLQTLSERSGDIAGLSDVIASFADGSQESVNAIAGMATASDEDLAAMVQNWKDLQAEQEEASGSIAELATNFSTEMDELQAELAKDIEEMDLGEEALASGRATIQGFIDGANSMLPEVQAAYSTLGQTARLALNYASGFSSYSVVAGRGYAGGTESAEQGIALVGERGPELVYFNGGERVVPAAQTAEILGGAGGSSITLSLAPVYQISGAADPERLQAVLDSNNEALRDMILEVIAEAGIDAARRAYA